MKKKSQVVIPTPVRLGAPVSLMPLVYSVSVLMSILDSCVNLDKVGVQPLFTSPFALRTPDCTVINPGQAGGTCTCRTKPCEMGVPLVLW